MLPTLPSLRFSGESGTFTHLQFGLCVFLLKNKHFAVSGEDVERTPLCHYINDIIERGTIGNELVVQVVDSQ